MPDKESSGRELLIGWSPIKYLNQQVGCCSEVLNKIQPNDQEMTIKGN